MTDPAALRRKALAVLREGRLTVVLSRCPDGSTRPHELVAAVRSSRDGGPTYAVDLRECVWSCTCGTTERCAHIAAAQLVAGSASEVAA